MEIGKIEKGDKENAVPSNTSTTRPSAIRSLSFTPLKLSLHQKDIFEAANEPLSTVEDILESDDDDVCVNSSTKAANEPLSTVEDILESDDDDVCVNSSTKATKTNNNNTKENDNSDSDTSKLMQIIFNTGSKKLINNYSTENCVDKVLKKECNIIERIEDKDESPELKKSTLNCINEHDDVHPIIPRIQCSVSRNSLMKTPMNPLKINKQQLSSGKFENRLRLNQLSGEFGLVAIKKQSETPKTFTTVIKQQKEDIVINNDFNFNKVSINGKTYITLKELGRGGSSIVYSCFDPVTKVERALKKVLLSKSETLAEEFLNEIGILKKLQKSNRIIKLYDSEIQNHPTEGKLLWLVLEKGGMDLGKILKKVLLQEKPLPNHIIMFYWMEMLYAVNQIHEIGVVHSDIKPANFIMAETSLKLIDFGIASCIQNDMTSVIKNIAVGSFEYISPEALLNDNSRNSAYDSPNFGKPKFKISTKSDVWSLGCILYELVFGKTPFHHIPNISAKIGTIMDPKHEINYPSEKQVPVNFLNAIKKCLKYNVKERPNIDELIKIFERES